MTVVGNATRWPTRPTTRIAMWLGCWLALVLVSPAEVLRIATYNVENYGLADRMTAAGYRRSYPKPETEKAALRVVIRGLSADVLVLQEVGGAGFLEELRRDLQAEGCVYPFTALGAAADTERQLAILSRRPLRDVRTHPDLQLGYFGEREPVKRGLLEATIDGGGGPVTLFAVHLKSRFTDRADDPLSAQRRAGEAVAIRDRVLQRFPQPSTARFLILGDCNDGRTSRPLAALQQRGKTRIAELLDAADSRGETWTHAFRREDTYSRVDHILVSPALRPEVSGGVAVVADAPAVRRAGDHRPVVVELVSPPNKKGGSEDPP